VKITTTFFQVTLAILLICTVSSWSSASILDVTVFGGFQNPGKLTFETAPGSATNLIANFDPHTFGVFGARLGHGGLIGGEHTIAYAANFLNSDTHAFIYHSNLRVMPTFGFVKPYATAGIGLVATGGTSIADFGTKFGFNYGGGVTLAGPVVGLNLDVRGYAVPKISVAGFTTQPRLDFIQASAGINFHF
jgi:Lipid A 3-O-deacylase (PagL)